MKKSKNKKTVKKTIKIMKVKTGSVKDFFAGTREVMRAADRGEPIKGRFEDVMSNVKKDKHPSILETVHETAKGLYNAKIINPTKSDALKQAALNIEILLLLSEVTEAELLKEFRALRKSKNKYHKMRTPKTNTR